MFEANTWGMLFYSATIADAYNPNHVWGIHLYGFIGLTLLFIRHAASLLQTLGYSGSVHIDISLSYMLGVPWLHGASFMFPKSGSEVDDDIRFSLRKSGEEICEKPDAIVMDILRYVFFAVNWSELVGSSQKLEDLVRMGYQYNSWQQPTKLQI